MKILPESGLEPKEYLEFLRDQSKVLLKSDTSEENFDYEKSYYIKYCFADFTERISQYESLKMFIVFEPFNYKATVFEILDIQLQLPCKDEKEKREFNTLLNYWVKLVDEERKLEPFKIKNEGCYIATMAYGDYNHPQVIELRKFRDEILSQSNLGLFFIKIYYNYSPILVNKLKDKPKTNYFIRTFLDQLVTKIRK